MTEECTDSNSYIVIQPGLQVQVKFKRLSSCDICCGHTIRLVNLELQRLK